MSELVIVTAMVCLTILGVATKVVTPEASEIFYIIVVAVAGLAGWAIPRAAVHIKNRITGRHK